MEWGRGLRSVIENNKNVKKILQIALAIGYFFLGFIASSLFTGEGSGTSQGQNIGIIVSWILFVSGIISLAGTVLIVVLLRRHDWYVFPAVAFLLLLSGIGIALLLDVIFITPQEYGERGWAWAAGRYGTWRVLR